MLTPVAITRLEKAATDNGFDLELEHTSDWLSFGSSQTSMRIWLTVRGESRFLAAMSQSDVLRGLDDLGVVFTDLLPSGAVGAASVRDIAALHRLLRRAFQLSRTLPDVLLHVFEYEIANLPRTTEAERLVVRRVGQDIFRRGLLEYWDGRCAITGLDVPDLLRASHIKPWADCDTDAERLDVYNGLLLAPHLDAAFDCGFITDRRGWHGGHLGRPPIRSARSALGLNGPLKIHSLHHAHERYMPWHRSRIFRTEWVEPQPINRSWSESAQGLIDNGSAGRGKGQIANNGVQTERIGENDCHLEGARGGISTKASESR